jgi:hypothetical protein
MQLHMESAALALKAGQFVTLEDACGTQIRIQNGSAWVTEEGDPNDFTLVPGEAHTVMHQGRTVVQAMNSAQITLREHAVPCAANDGEEAVAAKGSAWYSGGLRAVSNYFAGLSEDFEQKALADRVRPIEAYGVEEQIARYRVKAQLGYMESDPRYF